MTRRPSPPPELPGFRYLEPIGTGGFADVFLYEQQMPRRQVAVKVLLADRITTSAAEEFAEEANVMAMLSTHPAIVTIYQAGVAGDGRPYLVMEYCPRPNLQTRSRREPLSLAEALRVGVQVAGAVETAHRAGVLHRDIKPANILVTAYNRPALTDFGIASTTGAVTEAAGMSIPWSPPESFADPPHNGPSTDIYALGATLYTLLSGRSPFERPGARNTSADLIERIEREPLPVLGRADAPDSMRRVLERAMAKNPADRYPSAVAFARALQKVQIELSHSVTPIDIIDEHPALDDVDGEDVGLTRVKQVVSIDPSAQASTRPSATTEPKRVAPATPPGVPRFEAVPRPESHATPTSAAAEPAAPAGSAAPAVEETLPGHSAHTDTPVGYIEVPAVPPRVRPTPVGQQSDHTVQRTPQVVAPEGGGPAASGSAASAPAAATQADAKGATRSRLDTVIWVMAIVLAVIGIGAIVAANLLAPNRGDGADVGKSATPLPVQREIVPQVADLTGVRSGDQVTFTWRNPQPQEGDLYLWRVLDPEKTEPPVTADQEEAIVTSQGRTCIEVALRRSDGRLAEAATKCVP